MRAEFISVFRRFFREPGLFVWSLLFPCILGTMFSVMFNGLDEIGVAANIPVVIVTDGSWTSEEAETLRDVVSSLTEPGSGTEDGEPLLGTALATALGGGNVAIDAARVSARNGASSVEMLCLESSTEMPASPEEVREARADGVEIRCGWGPAEVLTNEDGEVTGIVFKRCTQVFDESGHFSPTYDETDTLTVACDRVIFAIGQAVDWGGLLDGSAVKLGRGGIPVADRLTYQTDEPDVFVGGDLLTGPKFAIDAIAQGHWASESLHRYVQGGHMTIGRNRWEFISLDTDEVTIPESYDRAPRQSAIADASVDEKGFRDESRTLTKEQVATETARCLSCGRTVVDPNKCIGCGICTTKCAFDAIHLKRDHPECTHMIRAEDKFKEILPYAAQRGIRILTHGKSEI